MFCKKCGREISDNEEKCPFCGETVGSGSQSPFGGQNYSAAQKPYEQQKPDRCLSAFILGLLGALFGISGGICTTVCGSIASSKSGNSAFILIVLGAIIGLVGACMCLKNPKIGSVLEAVSALMMIIRAFSKYGATFSVVVACLLMLAAAIIGIVSSFALNRKK